MGTETGIEWTDSTWSPIRVRVREDAAAIARASGYTSLIPIAEKMAGRVGPHCEHVSPGCENCYAETNNHRCLPANGTGLPYDRRSRDLVEPFVDDKALLQPLKWQPIIEHSQECRKLEVKSGRRWKSKCGCPTRPRRIFVENQSDLFGEWVPDELLDRVFAVMALCPQHTFQVLTKRPERMMAYVASPEREDSIPFGAGEIIAEMYSEESPFSADFVARLLENIKALVRNEFGRIFVEYESARWPLPNVWLGVSVENQAAADERIPLLLQTPAAVRFLSCEPLLGSVSLRWKNSTPFGVEHPRHKFPRRDAEGRVRTDEYDGLRELDWVIAGCESGPGSRDVPDDLFRGLRDECDAAGVAFFLKQMKISGKLIHVPVLDGVAHKAFPQGDAQ